MPTTRSSKRVRTPVSRFIDDQSNAIIRSREEKLVAQKKKMENQKKKRVENQKTEAKKKREEVIEVKRKTVNGFVLSGATGYGSSANGTYVYKRDKDGIGQLFYNQIEDPNWWLEYTNPKYGVKIEEWDEELKKACDYRGWVAKWEGVKNVRCGYVRSNVVESSDKPWEVSTWQVLNENGESPNSEACDWTNYKTWRKEECPVFASNNAITCTVATDEDVANAKAEATAKKQLLSSIVKGKFIPPAVKAIDPAGTYGTFIPIPGVYSNQRPVYAGVSSQGRYMELKHEKCGRDGHKWQCYVGDCYISSPCECNSVLPQDVLNWEYDDGHYARWGIGGASVVIQKDKKDIKSTLEKLKKKPEYLAQLK